MIILNRVIKEDLAIKVTFGQLGTLKGVGRVFAQMRSKMRHVLEELQWWMEWGEWGAAGVGNEVPEIGGYHAGQDHWLLLCAR